MECCDLLFSKIKRGKSVSIACFTEYTVHSMVDLRYQNIPTYILNNRHIHLWLQEVYVIYGVVGFPYQSIQKADSADLDICFALDGMMSFEPDIRTVIVTQA